MRGQSEAAWERAMSVQEVISRVLAKAKRITWWQAAEILRMADRSMHAAVAPVTVWRLTVGFS